MFLKWIETGVSDLVFMNKNRLIHYQLQPSTRLKLIVGIWEKEVYVTVDESLSNDSIGLSVKWQAEIGLPGDVIYEVNTHANELWLGPFIGMIMKRKKHALTTEVLQLLKERLKQYEKIKGIVIAATQDQIDLKNKKLTGFYYTRNGNWKKGTFPLPRVFYNRTFFPPEVFQELTGGLRIKIFNHSRLTKGKLWRLLSNHEKVKGYLPYTQKLRGYKSLKRMINQFGKVYLKPTGLSRGRGIVRVETIENKIAITTGDRKVDYYQNRRELNVYLKSLLKKRKYLIQQALPNQYGDRLVDFRVFLQKDQTKAWGCSGIIGRVSKPQCIVTNYHYAEEMDFHHKIFERFFQFNHEQINSLESRMIQACQDVCTALEDLGQVIGDVALDLVVDPNELKIWILEVQINYAVDNRLYSLPKPMREKIWTTPLEYAKALIWNVDS